MNEDNLDVKFCRILSRLFPNLEQLYITDCYANVDYDFLKLDLFVKLCRHNIQQVDSDSDEDENDDDEEEDDGTINIHTNKGKLVLAFLIGSLIAIVYYLLFKSIFKFL